jgi:hypothetical protein
MIGEDLDQFVLVFGLQQVFDGACRQFGESLIGWCENREGSIPLQRFDKPGSLYRSHERVEFSRPRRDVDDVLRAGLGALNGITMRAAANSNFAKVMMFPSRNPNLSAEKALSASKPARRPPMAIVLQSSRWSTC